MPEPRWPRCNCPIGPLESEVIYDSNLVARCPRCNVALGGDPAPSLPPEEAQVGDACGMLIATGADGQAMICDGTLDPYVDVHGVPPGCTCHVSPPCHTCVEAPLACATCHETVP